MFLKVGLNPLNSKSFKIGEDEFLILSIFFFFFGEHKP